MKFISAFLLQGVLGSCKGKGHFYRAGLMPISIFRIHALTPGLTFNFWKLRKKVFKVIVLYFMRNLIDCACMYSTLLPIAFFNHILNTKNIDLFKTKINTVLDFQANAVTRRFKSYVPKRAESVVLLKLIQRYPVREKIQLH